MKPRRRPNRLLPAGQRVRLKTDPTRDARDRYGRLLVYVAQSEALGSGGGVNYTLGVRLRRARGANGPESSHVAPRD